MFIAGVALLKAGDPVALPSYVAVAVVTLTLMAIALRIAKGCSRRLDARALRHRKRRIA